MAKDLESSSTKGSRRAVGRPRSSTISGSRDAAASRTHFPVCACSSRIESVFIVTHCVTRLMMSRNRSGCGLPCLLVRRSDEIAFIVSRRRAGQSRPPKQDWFSDRRSLECAGLLALWIRGFQEQLNGGLLTYEFPWVYQIHASALKVGDIPSCQGKSALYCRRSDQGIIVPHPKIISKVCRSFRNNPLHGHLNQ